MQIVRKRKKARIQTGSKIKADGPGSLSAALSSLRLSKRTNLLRLDCPVHQVPRFLNSSLTDGQIAYRSLFEPCGRRRKGIGFSSENGPECELRLRQDNFANTKNDLRKVKTYRRTGRQGEIRPVCITIFHVRDGSMRRTGMRSGLNRFCRNAIDTPAADRKNREEARYERSR